MKKISKNKRGSIALTLVLLISGILLFGGISALTASIDSNLSSKAYVNTSITKIRAQSCIEESLYKLKNNPAYTGNFTLTFSDGNCTSTITGSSNIKTAAITSTTGSYNYQVTKTINTSTSPYTVL